MKHVFPILIKFIVSFLVLAFFLNSFLEISFLDLLLTTAIFVTFSYTLGDTLVLPKTNYSIAAIFDFVFSFATIGFMVYILTNVSGGFLLPSAISAATITVFEIFFHPYLTKNVFPDRGRRVKEEHRPIQLQTEFSEELDPKGSKKD